MNKRYTKNMNSIISYFFVFIMVFSIAFSTPVFAIETKENVAMATQESSFQFSDGKITGYTGTATDVEIPDKINGETVNAIGDKAFCKKNLTSVKIPKTVQNIGTQAFANNNLTSIELPENLKEMGNVAFGINQLKTIKIPKKLTNIPTGAFSSNQLTSVVISEGVEGIGTSAFKSNKELKAITIPASVERIGSGAFDKNIKLTYSKLVQAIEDAEKIKIEGKSEEKIQEFKTAIEEGKTINNKTTATLLEVNAAVDKINNAIKALEEGESVNASIKEIKALQNIEVVCGTSEADVKAKLPAKATIVDSKDAEHSVDIIWSMSAYNGNNIGEYTALGTFELPEGIVQSNPPKDLKVTVKIIVKDKVAENKEWDVNDFRYAATAITGFSESGKEKFKTNKNLILSDFNQAGQAITEIGDKAFISGEYRKVPNTDKEINSVKIPSTVKVIGKEAFRYNSLTSIDIPSSVETIKMTAFNGNKLKTLVIPNTVTKLEEGAFTLNEIESLKLPDNWTTIPAAFAFNNLTSVTIPEGVTRIDDLAFSDNRLSEVKLPSTLKYLSGLNNNEFRSITIPKTVTELGPKALASSWMTSVTIPGNVKIIGERAFWNTWHDQFLSSVVIEEGVERIDAFAFCNNHLKDVQLPSSVKQLNKDTFSTNLGYDGVVHVYTPNYENPNNFEESKYHLINPAKITMKYVFGDKVLNEKEIWKNPKTGVYLHVGDKAVEVTPEYNDNEYELKDKNTIKVSLNDKENVVIVQCKKKQVAEKIKIKSIGKVTPVVVDFGTDKSVVMDKLERKTFIIDSNNQEHQVELTWTIGIYDGDKAGEYTAVGTFKLPEGIVQSEPETKLEVISKVIVKEKLGNPQNSEWKVEDFTYEGTTITGFSPNGIEKFKNNKALVLSKVNGEGKDITSIAEGAFAKMGLTSLTIPEGVNGLVVKAGAFKENKLEKVYIPEGVKEILTLAFYKNDLVYVELPGTLEKVGNQAFANNKLVSANIAKGIGKICLDRFSFCDNQLTSVTILKKVNKVHEEAFKNNTGHENDNNKVHVFMAEVDPENNGLFEYSNHHKIILLSPEVVEKLNPIELFVGTVRNNIDLPKKIKLKLNNGDIREVNVTWSSSNKELVVVDAAGKVTGIKEGTAIMTATTEVGSKVATCEVVVKLSEIVSSKSGSSSRSENIPKLDNSSKSQEIAVLIKNIKEDYLVNNKVKESNNFKQSFTEFSCRYSSAIAKFIANNAKLNRFEKVVKKP